MQSEDNKYESEQIHPLKVVDAICGSGKTSFIFNHIRSCGNEKKWIFVSPYLDEVGEDGEQGRIQKELPEFKFVSPTPNPNKSADFLRHVKKGRNIAITHKLFTIFTLEIAQAIKEQGYSLVIDETIDLVNFYEDVVGDDVAGLVMAGFILQGESGHLSWNYDKFPNYNGRDKAIKDLCDIGCLWLYGDNILIQRVPPSCIGACKEVFILTYMFEGSLMHSWCKLNNLSWEYYTPPSLRDTKQIKNTIRESLNIISPSSIIKDIHYKDRKYREGVFSASWWANASVPLLTEIKSSVESTLKHNMTKGNTFWTTFKDYKDIMAGRGYSRSVRGRSPFLSKNTRASNEYRDCTKCIYMVNIYPNTTLENHLKQFGVEIDRDKYALSEMIQFIFRGCIRDEKEMDVLILSERMRTLLEEWLKQPE